MRAVICRKYGGPEVLQIEEVDVPHLKAEEYLVRVAASSVNRTDCANLRAKPFIMRFVNGLLKPKNAILGTEFSGTVVEAGIKTTKFKKGDRIVGFNDTGIQAHAEYLCVSEKKALSYIHGNQSFAMAAACNEGAHYAYNILNKVNLKKGQRVLVNGASGAIGSALVQLLHFYELNITAVCGTKNIELVESLGAHKVIDYQVSDFTKMKIVDQFEYIFDAVGKSSFGKSKHLLKKGGIYISSELGKGAENIFLALRPKFLCNKHVIFPIPRNTQESVDLVQSLIGKGVYKAVIDRIYGLNEIRDAYHFVETGEKTGSVIIQLSTE